MEKVKEDHTARRLAVREKIQRLKFEKLIRGYENAENLCNT